MTIRKIDKLSDRRNKTRFAIHRELKYKLVNNMTVTESGNGQTVNIGSGGVCFFSPHTHETGCYIELSISWPVLLDDTLPMRLIVFGRVLRSERGRTACSIEKYEFRTQSRIFQTNAPPRADSMLQRWAESLRKDSMMKSRTAVAV